MCSTLAWTAEPLVISLKCTLVNNTHLTTANYKHCLSITSTRQLETHPDINGLILPNPQD